MQENNHLTSPEISNLWTHYIRETLSLCVNKYMLHTIKDPEIHSLFQLTHMNIWRSYKVVTSKKFRVFLAIMDDHSKATRIYLLKYK